MRAMEFKFISKSVFEGLKVKNHAEGLPRVFDGTLPNVGRKALTEFPNRQGRRVNVLHHPSTSIFLFSENLLTERLDFLRN